MNEEKIVLKLDAEMKVILETLLADDQDITARAVARLHPTIKAASSITRSETRTALLADYQKRQHEYRTWRGRVGKQSAVDTAAALAKKDHRIAELEACVQILTTSHVALLRAVGAMGGFSRWAQFFEKHQDVRRKLTDLGAIPESVTPMQDALTIKTSSRQNANK
jgi:cell division FtsZ-interacting protein ZapD